MHCYSPCSDEAAGPSSTEYRVPAQDQYAARCRAQPEDASRKQLFWSPEEEDAEARRAALPPRARASRSMAAAMLPQSLNLAGVFPRPYGDTHGQSIAHAFNLSPCGDEHDDPRQRRDPRLHHDIIMMTPPASGRFPFCDGFGDVPAAGHGSRPSTPPPTWWLPGCGETPVAEPELVWGGPEESTPSRFRRPPADIGFDPTSAGRGRQAHESAGAAMGSDCCLPAGRHGDDEGTERGCATEIARGINECLEPTDLKSPLTSPRVPSTSGNRREATPSRRRQMVGSRPALS